MKSILATIHLFCLVFLGVSGLQGQQTDSLQLPAFGLLRAEEDYSGLKEKALRHSLWRKVKYIPLGHQAYLSIGGNIRSEVQYRINEDWVEQQNVALFQRLMVHTDVWFSPHIRVFHQFKAGYTLGRNGPFFLDNDAIDVHQLFFEVKKKNIRFRLGRQELNLGARRLVSIREGTNIRQSFDGFRAIGQAGLWKIDVLGMAYNPQNVNAFDNRINTDELLWGVYATKQLRNKPQSFEFYYLGFQDQDANYVRDAGKELRHSLGIRWAGSLNRLKINNEMVFQFGSLTGQPILAWTISTDVNYLFEAGSISSVGLKFDVISGDNPNTATLESFNALYPIGGYFGLLALIGPSNLIDVHPSVGFALTDRLSAAIDMDVFWRYSLGDGIYFPSGRLNRLPDGATNRFIGYQAGVQLAFSVNRFWSIESSYFHFFNGSFIQEITADHDISQLTLTTSFTF